MAANLRQINFLGWRRLGFFDKRMQQYHLIALQCEQHAGNARGKLGANFPHLAAELFYQGHAQGPPELHRFDVFVNGQTLMRGQTFQRVSNDFTARRSLVKVNL